jgi:hypothetical protein
MLKFIATYPLTCIASTTLAILVSVIFPAPVEPPKKPQRVTIVDLWAPPYPPPVIEPVLPPAPPPVVEPLPIRTTPVILAVKPKSEIPHWVLKGIAKVETNSTIKDCGTIIWRDRRKGKNGDSGVFQMTRIAFNQVKRPGDSFARIHRDPKYAQELAERYLVYLRKRYTRWHDVIAAYNAGTPGRPAGRRYLKKVLAASS